MSQELHLDSVAVDLTVISLWPSVESRLKMLDIITVRVYTVEKILMVIVRVIVCSHSDKESYKNLRHGDWTDPAAAQTLSHTLYGEHFKDINWNQAFTEFPTC